MLNGILVVLLAAIVGMSDGTSVAAAGLDQHSYPRIMGMNISRPSHYDTQDYQAQLSKPAIMILGFYEGWGKSKKTIAERDVVKHLKEINPNLLVGQYTILNEWKDIDEPSNARRKLSKKLDDENWWLRDENNKRVQWTNMYHAWDINLSAWTTPDRDGNRYPEWLAQADYETFFRPVPEFDIWYFDNALSRPEVKKADWDGDGRDDSRDDPRIAAAYRRGNLAHWIKARQLHPTAIFIGNSDDVSSPEYSGKLEGVFMEGVIGTTWSMDQLKEQSKGWDAIMKRYRAAIQHTAAPHIIGFNVHGSKDNYQRMRYGLTSCLMDDGYFSYTDEKVGYGSVPWFDEYDVVLGRPMDPPSLQPWQNGVYRRRFEHGTVLVNPDIFPRTITVDQGYRRIKGMQASDVNDGKDVSVLSLPGKDGIILIKR